MEKQSKSIGKIRIEHALIATMVVLVFGAGASYAAFYRTIGDEGFEYGYGYSVDLGEFGYGYGYLEGELDEDQTEDHGFFGDDGGATDVSASATKRTITVTYTTDYLAQNRINYGLTDEFGSNSAQSDFETGENSIQISDLSCGTTYFYRVETTDAGDNVWYDTDESNEETTDACASGGGGGASKGAPWGPATAISVIGNLPYPNAATPAELQANLTFLRTRLLTLLQQLVVALQAQLAAMNQ